MLFVLSGCNTEAPPEKAQTKVSPLEHFNLVKTRKNLNDNLKRKGLIENIDKKNVKITFTIDDWKKIIVNNKTLLVSIEVPGSHPSGTGTIDFKATLEGKNIETSSLSKKTIPYSLDDFPPGPNNDTSWVSYVANITKEELGEIKIQVSMPDLFEDNFTRILLGAPSTPNSRLIGVYNKDKMSKASLKSNIKLPSSYDFLGTSSAVQRIVIPVGAFGFVTEEYDELVEFGAYPFDPKYSNIDTIMYRPYTIKVGETVPIEIVKFQNKTKHPITLQTEVGKQEFDIEATLSPNAYSGGFITIREDGTYRSTTSLTPLFTFYVLENGKRTGAAIQVDAAKMAVKGFPFYLSSNTGKWSTKTASKNILSDTRSAFFYNNGATNLFSHSNGLPGGVLAACKKSTAVFNH